jgi:hypothetical protein
MISRDERIKLMIEVRDAVFNIVKAVFEDIDKQIEEDSFYIETIKHIKTNTLKLKVKALKQFTLSNIENIGEGYEPDNEPEQSDLSNVRTLKPRDPNDLPPNAG